MNRARAAFSAAVVVVCGATIAHADWSVNDDWEGLDHWMAQPQQIEHQTDLVLTSPAWSATAPITVASADQPKFNELSITCGYLRGVPVTPGAGALDLSIVPLPGPVSSPVEGFPVAGLIVAR